MDFKKLSDRAIEIREKYQSFEIKDTGKVWTKQEIMEGFVGDVGDLMKFVMAKEGRRKIDNVDEKLKHELCDCLWCILVLAKKYEIDIEAEFVEKMSELEKLIDKKIHE
jgi:NTP pyrophosphatase (non-canonical NTP hydrolase)